MNLLNYVCHCGATLKYSSKGEKWLCPNGCEVYSCKTCGAAGRNVPLQWIAQYQRWYCYECKEYVSSTTSEEEKIEGYTLEIPKGSRVDEFCFRCRHLKFTQNNTHVKCELNVPRYQEPAISEITVRPEGSGKGGLGGLVADICYKISILKVNLQNWLVYIENRVAKQIENHEKDAAQIETYRIEFIGGDVMAMGQGLDRSGAKAYQTPVNRDSMLTSGTTVTIDKTYMKVWVRAPKPSGIVKGVSKFMGAIAGSIEKDPLNLRYLRDLLKRDIESFDLEKIQIGQEPQEFWEVIDRGATLPVAIKPKEVVEQPPITGSKIEVYEINYHLGRTYLEIYTGGRSESETKTISLQPLKTSAEELQPKRKVVVVDHQSKVVWQWIGSKVLWKSGYQSVASDSNNRRRHLTFIGSHIGRNIDDYDYRIIEEKREPEQFKKLLPNWPH